MRLSCGQLWAVLFLFRVLSFFSSTSGYSLPQMEGLVLSAMIQASVLVPFVHICIKNDISAEGLGKTGILFSACFIFSGICMFRKLAGVSQTERFIFSDGIWLILPAGLAAVYCGSRKIRAAGRASVITAGLLILFTAVLAVTCIGQTRAEYILSSAGENSAVGYAVRDLAESTEFPSVLALSVFSGSDRLKSIKTFLITGSAYTVMISVLGAALLGRVSQISDHPFFEMCSFSSPLGGQRSDAFFTGIYMLAAVVSISVCTAAASVFLRKYIKYPSAFSAALMTSAGIITGNNGSAYTELMISVILIIMLLLCVMFRYGSEPEKEANA